MKLPCIQQSYQVPLLTYPQKMLTTFQLNYKTKSNNILVVIRINEKRMSLFSKKVRLISNMWGKLKVILFPKDDNWNDLRFKVQLLD